MITARPYRSADRDACLALFDSNTPRFFDATERAGFAGFLDDIDGRYEVLEQDGRIVACGGWSVEPEGTTASLCWGMVDQARHRQGLGAALTEARIAAARAHPGLTALRLGTGPETATFYARYGFTVVSVVPDGNAPGIDAVEMRLAL